MAGIISQRYPGNDFAIFFGQLHLAAGDQRIVVRADVTNAIALALHLADLPLAARRKILCIGESWDSNAVAYDRVPSAMVKVQMRIDDDINLLGRDSN